MAGPSKRKSGASAPKLSQEFIESDNESDVDRKPTAKKSKKVKARAESSEEEDEDDDEDSYEDDDDDGGKSRSNSSEKKKQKNKQASSKHGRSSESNPIKKNSEGDAYVELSNARRVTIRSFKGSTLIDIRETYSKDGKDGLPGKKGISLTHEQYKTLKDLIPSIDQAIERL